MLTDLQDQIESVMELSAQLEQAANIPTEFDPDNPAQIEDALQGYKSYFDAISTISGKHWDHPTGEFDMLHVPPLRNSRSRIGKHA